MAEVFIEQDNVLIGVSILWGFGQSDALLTFQYGDPDFRQRGKLNFIGRGVRTPISCIY
jgi:hypothetical protein